MYGFTAMLINVLRDEQPTHVAVAFDRSEPTFRHEQYVEYKANRRETPEDFRSQLSLIFEVLDALGIARLSAAGFEADDVIATLATRAENDGMDVLIVTGDRDVLQLVDDHVTVLMTRRGITDMSRFTPAAVEEKYGLTPQQYPDFAAIRGDPSDNLPGIPGVGEKTATKWVREFGSLEELVNRVDEVKGKAGDALREHLGDVLRNRQMTALVRDVPLTDIGAGPDELIPRVWDREQIHQLFDTLQFRVLRERLYATLPDGICGVAAGETAAAEPAAGFDVEVRLLGPDEVAEWIADHAATVPAAADSAVAGPRRATPGRARGARPDDPHRAGGQRHLGPRHRDAERDRDRRTGRPRRLPRPDRADRVRLGRARGLARRPRTCPRPCTTPRARCTRSPRTASSWPG